MKLITSCCCINSRGTTTRSVRRYHKLESATGDRSRLTWKLVWRKLLREKRKMFDHNYQHSWNYRRDFHVPYDEHSYAKNFDQGLGWYRNMDNEGEAVSGICSVRISQIIQE